jgi:hypothetical protein
MRTRKKILLIISSLGITALFSAAIAYGLTIWDIPFGPVFILACIAQIGGSLLYDKFYESNRLFSVLEEYRAKPYKDYVIDLNCAHCGHKNEVTIDLTETEFRCENCNKFNGIHVNFLTAAVTEPII